MGCTQVLPTLSDKTSEYHKGRPAWYYSGQAYRWLPAAYQWLTGGLVVACWWLPCEGSIGPPKCDIVAHFVGLTLSLQVKLVQWFILLAAGKSRPCPRSGGTDEGAGDTQG
jgi:hypothetical protein